MALGVKSTDVPRLVIEQGFKLRVICVGAGTAGALGITCFVVGLLYDVKLSDLLTFVPVSGTPEAVAQVHPGRSGNERRSPGRAALRVSALRTGGT